MFLHLLKNRFKVLLRSKALIFWTLAFPIVLGLFFKLALSNVAVSENFKVINIAVVKNDNFQEEKNLKTIIESLSKENEEQVFNTKYVEGTNDADELLKSNDISGYILMDGDYKVKVIVKQNGIEQTIIKYVVDEYYQMNSMAQSMIAYNPKVLYDGTMNLLYESPEYLENKSGNNLDFAVNYYYTLIAMACIYGGIFGINAICETEANLSKKAARVSVSPINKAKALFANLFASFIIQYVEILILLAYITFILGGTFGGNIIWILILSFVGSFAGTAFGMFIGASNKLSEGSKTGVLIAITMTCCFMAGMMGEPSIKYNLESMCPIFKYNPVSLITDGLYSLYSYTTLDVYFEKLIGIAIFSIVMFVLSFVFIRRKKYDSI